MAQLMTNRSTKKSVWVRWLFRFLILSALVGGGALWLRFRPKKTITVKTVQLEIGTIYDLINSESAGDILSKDVASVRSQVSGQVTMLPKKIKDRVRKGDLIAAVNASDVLAQLEQAEKSMQSARAQVAQAKARVQTLQSQLELAKNLQQRGAGTSQGVRDAQNALREATASQTVFVTQFWQSQAAKKVLEVNLERTKFYAPIDGVITDVPIHLGDSISPGSLVFQMINDQNLYVEINIAEADANKIREGQKVKLSLDALPKTPLTGQVSLIDPVLKKDLKGARLLRAEVQFIDLPKAKEAGVKPGLSANAEMLVDQKENVLVLPSNAIIGTGVERFIYVAKPEGKFYRLKKIKIQVGLSNWEWTEINPSQGTEEIKKGDLVVTSLNDVGVEEGTLVAIENKQKR